jgi:hypothetical protein
MFSKILLLTLFAVTPTIAKQVCADEDLVKDSLTIGTFPTLLSFGPPGTPALSTTATADYYSCAKNGQGVNTNKAPLVIIIPGADAGKAEYSMAAKAFVDRGYTAAVLEEPVAVNQFQTLYLASSRSLKVFIDIVTAMDDFPADTDQIFLAGHSFGGSTVLYYLQGYCPPPLCVPGVPGLSVFDRSDKIKAVGAFATTLTLRNDDDSFRWNEGLNNAGFPFFIVNGEFDAKNFDIIEGQLATYGTTDRLTPFNGLATIDGLDHYSIVNRLASGASTNNYQDSTESREFQVEAAVTPLDTWFKTAVTGKLEETCDDQLSKAAASPYSLTRCKVTTLPVNLGTACNYAILAKSGISTVPTSTIKGNIGVSPIAATAITGFGLTLDSEGQFATSSQVNGQAHGASYGGPIAKDLTIAVLAMQAAYTAAAALTTTDTSRIEFMDGKIGGATLTPGVYTFTTGVSIMEDLTFAGGANDVFVIQTTGVLTIAAERKVILTGGVLAKNIFWQVAGNAAIGADAEFHGILLVFTDVALITGSSLVGSIYSQTAVNLQMATVTQPDGTCATPAY